MAVPEFFHFIARLWRCLQMGRSATSATSSGRWPINSA
jgi:hypothetical protein